MKASKLKESFKLYAWAFGYISFYKKWIGLALLLSVLLSVTSSVAAYSFLPVFDLVFTDDAIVAEPSQLGRADGSLGEMFGSGNLEKRFTFKVKEYYEQVAGAGAKTSQLVRLVVFIVALSVVNTLLAMLVDYSFIVIQAGGTRRLRVDAFNHLSKMPLSFFDKSRSGVLVSRVENDVGGTVAMVAGSLSGLLQNTFLALSFFILLLLINVRLALTVLPILFLIGVIVTLLGQWARHNRHKLLVLRADITAVIQEFLAGIKIIKGFVAEGRERDKWYKMVEEWRGEDIIGNTIKAFPNRLRELMAILISGAVIIFGGRLVIMDALSVAELTLFFIVLVKFQTPISLLANVWVNIQNGMAYAKRSFDLLAMPEEKSNGSKRIESINEALVLSGVSFSYGEELVLDNVSVEIPAGKVTAIVGPSGSGKSSLVDLIMRFYQPVSGQILIDGHNIEEYAMDDYRSLFGIVTQDTFLFHDTIWQNIVYGLNREVDKSEVEEAVKAANAHDFIMDFSAGYDTVLGDRGVRLSGGQRQRVAIARAVLRDPKILILDEATSALDTQSERQVQEAIDRLIKNRATVVIAHRLSTIQRADNILVLHEGKIIEQGTHAELLGLGKLYAELWKLQAGIGN